MGWTCSASDEISSSLISGLCIYNLNSLYKQIKQSWNFLLKDTKIIWSVFIHVI